MNRTFHHNVSLRGHSHDSVVGSCSSVVFPCAQRHNPCVRLCVSVDWRGRCRPLGTHHIHIHRRRQPRDSTWQTWQEHNYCRQRNNSGTCGARHIVHGAPHRDRIRLRKDNLCTAAADKRIHRRNSSQAKAGISIEYSQKPK